MSDPIQLYIFCKTDHPSLLDNTPPTSFITYYTTPLPLSEMNGHIILSIQVCLFDNGAKYQTLDIQNFLQHQNLTLIWHTSIVQVM